MTLNALHPDLTVIVINYKTPALLHRCLRSLRTYAAHRTIEVIVIDNASKDGSVDFVRREFPEMRLIENQENLGFSRANNQGMRQAAGRYLLLLNSDAEVRDDTLDLLIEFMDGHPQVGLANPKLVGTEGTLQPQPRHLPRYWRDAVGYAIFWSTPIHRVFGRKLEWRDFEPRRDYDQECEVEWVRGAAMMIRREVMREIGLLDENFFFGYEEIDYSIRARQAGWKLYYVPSAVVVHHGSRSHVGFGRSLSIKIRQGDLYFWDKHGTPLQVWFLRLVLAGLTSGIMIWRTLKILVLSDRKREMHKYKIDLEMLQVSLFGNYPRARKTGLT